MRSKDYLRPLLTSVQVPLLAFVFAILIPATLVAQSPDNKQDTKFSDSKPFTMRLYTETNEKARKLRGDGPLELIIPVTIYGKNGYFKGNLKDGEAEAYFNERKLEDIEYLSPQTPLSIALVIDVSPSSTYFDKELVSFAKDLYERVQKPDLLRIFTLSDRLKEIKPEQDGTYKFKKQLKLQSNGTGAYDSIVELTSEMTNCVDRQCAVVLVTDGVDTVSKKPLYESLAAIARSNVRVYPLYLETERMQVRAANRRLRRAGSGMRGTLEQLLLDQQIRLRGGNRGIGTSPEEHMIGRRFLDDLTAISGGSSRYFANFVKDKDGIEAFLKYKIRPQLLIKKKIKSIPESPVRVPVWTRVKRPGLILRSRGVALY